MNQQNENYNLVRFGMIGLSQIIFAAATLVTQRQVSNWLSQKDIEKCRPKPIRGFQKTPML